MISKIISFIIISYILFLVVSILIRKTIQYNIRVLFTKCIPVFNTSNIEYWVDFGTLLGVHREKDIIIGDNDCDICIWEKDQDQVRNILKNLSSSNFEEYDWGAFRIFYNNDLFPVFMDVYKCKIYNNVIQIPSARDTPIELLEDFEIVELPFYNNKNFKMRQPVKWEQLLEFRYTKSWKKQLHKWYLGYFSLENVKLS